MELVQNDYTRMLEQTPICSGLCRIEETRSCEGIQVRKARYEFEKHEILIVRSQWTKTQGGWAIRVNNYYAEKNHFLQIPVQQLKQCYQIINVLKEEGTVKLWTGHVINSGDFIK